MSGQTMRNDPGLGIPRTIFGPEHELFRDTVRRFLEAEIVPYHEAWEEVRLVPREAWLKAGKTGLLGTEEGPLDARTGVVAHGLSAHRSLPVG